MRRKAGILVLLGMLGGCFAPHADPQVLDLTATGEAPGSALALVGRPRGPAGSQDGVARRSGGWPAGATPGTAGQGDAGAGSTAQGSAGSRGGPVAGNAVAVAALASRTTPGPLTDYVAARPDGPGRSPGLSPDALAAGEPRPPAVGVPVVNSKRIQIKYEIKDVGPSGLDTVELWYTHNRGPWQKYAAVPKEPPFVFDVDQEGLYGFTLLARNRAGQGKTRPEPNDPPQASVEVDLTKPAVEVASPQYDAQGRTLTVLWQASDKNLGSQPIALNWAREPTGPWMPIITQLENTGRYVWKLPNGVPARVWLRVEASDLAGNVGSARTAEAVAVGPGTGGQADAVLTAAPAGPDLGSGTAKGGRTCPAAPAGPDLGPPPPGQPAAAIVTVGASQSRPGRVPLLTMEPLDR
jgi:hypothetical protein